ncbi:MAG: hypothetical protein P4L50_00110 [Anaerolineaceae bacterium]|nr:hypothetical protein [Anaerolineaceae bacterium]
MAQIVKIPIPKAGPDAFLEVDLDGSVMPDAIFQQIVLAGLEVVLNKRMSSKKIGAITKKTGAELEAAQAEAMKVAKENLENLYKGSIGRKGKAKAKDELDRTVRTEARRLARELVKNEIRKAGGKPSHYSAAEITKFADVFIDRDASIIEKAKANLASREIIIPDKVDESEKAKAKADLEALGLKPDPKKVAKAEAEKAERKTQLSAKQAGATKKVAGRSKPKAEQAPSPVLQARPIEHGSHATH